MLFNSYQFLFGFLPLVLMLSALFARWQRGKALVGVLVLASLAFYGWWNWRYLSLILFSILFNFGWGRVLQRRRQARPREATQGLRWALALGVGVNLGLLGYFKYTNFFLETVNAALGVGWHLRAIVLPLGISFFTFEQIIYLVDAYRGETPAHDFRSYCLFVTFFPHLIAGPIVRPRELLPQFVQPSRLALSREGLADGLFILAIGLFKKVVMADTLGGWAGPLFDRTPVLAFSDAWGAALAFTLQVYFDFSGYTDMAIGLARMLNVRLPENFDSPYKATSIIDFWRRWHMTLSAFLRDYAFFPLGGLRRRADRRYGALILTMLLCGLWHGANWNFVVFGGLHGLYLAVNHLWRHLHVALPKTFCWAITFVAVVVAFVFFRAQSLLHAAVILKGMAGLSGFEWAPLPHSIGRHAFRRIALALLVVLACPNRQAMVQWRWPNDFIYATCFALLAGISILQLGNPLAFLYFQF